MSAQQAAIFNIIEKLSPGENAYSAIRAYLNSQILPIAPNSYRIQLYIFIIIISATLIAITITLYNTCRKRFWLFHLQKGRSSLPYIVPHGTILWIILAIIFEGLFIVFLVKNLINSRGTLVIDLIEWETMVWSVLFLTGWSAMIPQSTTYLIQLSKDRNTNFHPIINFLIGAPFVNFIAISVPLLQFTSSLALSITSAKHYRKSISIYLQIDQQLALGEAVVNAGGKFSLLDLASGAALQDNLVAEFNLFTLWFGRFFLCILFFVVFLVALLITFTYLNLRSIRTAIKSTEYLNTQTENSYTRNGINSDGKHGKDQLIQIKKAYQRMLITNLCILLVAIFESVNALNSAIASQYILEDPSVIRNGLLTAVYLFTIPAVPIATTVLIRSFDINYNQSLSNDSVPISPKSITFPRIDVTKFQRGIIPTTVELKSLRDVDDEWEKKVLPSLPTEDEYGV